MACNWKRPLLRLKHKISIKPTFLIGILTTSYIFKGILLLWSKKMPGRSTSPLYFFWKYFGNLPGRLLRVGWKILRTQIYYYTNSESGSRGIRYLFPHFCSYTAYLLVLAKLQVSELWNRIQPDWSRERSEF